MATASSEVLFLNVFPLPVGEAYGWLLLALSHDDGNHLRGL